MDPRASRPSRAEPGKTAAGACAIPPRLRVGILGAGRIAQGYDAPGRPRILSLAHAVRRSRRLELAGFFDLRRGRAAAAERKWECPPSPRQRAAWLDSGWDVVIVATPDAAHPADLRDVLARRPRAVMVEKPLALDGSEARDLLREAERAGVPLAVNFPRRWHRGVQRVSAWFREGKLSPPLEIRARCSGGLKHNGIHFLDLVADWFGATGTIARVENRADGTLLEIRTGERAVTMRLSDARQKECYVWEMECDTPDARVEVRGSPEILRVCSRRAHPIFRDVPALVEIRRWDMDEEPLLLRAVEHLAAMAVRPSTAEAHRSLEQQRHRFFEKVFEHVDS